MQRVCTLVNHTIYAVSRILALQAFIRATRLAGPYVIVLEGFADNAYPVGITAIRASL